METNSFTRAPWKLVKADYGYTEVLDSSGRIVCDNRDPAYPVENEYFPLIAASPELLSAVQKLLSDIESHIHSEYDGTSMVENLLAEYEPIRQLITKATKGAE